MSLSSEMEELPIYKNLRLGGQSVTLVIDQDKYRRYAVWWEEEQHLFPISFATLREAQDFTDGWLDMIEAGEMISLQHKESILPSGKDCMGLFALLLLLGTLVLLLYLFG